ncbi:MAG TPA: hypothetical protein V6D07_03310 [Trichocoleus sp.]
MAFTVDEQEKIRRYFGYPAATGWMRQIQDFCNRVSEASAEAEETAKALLCQIDKLDFQVRQARPFATHPLQSRMGDSTHEDDSGEPLNVLKREQASLVRELSNLLGLPIHREIFGSGGWQTSKHPRRG